MVRLMYAAIVAYISYLTLSSFDSVNYGICADITDTLNASASTEWVWGRDAFELGDYFYKVDDSIYINNMRILNKEHTEYWQFLDMLYALVSYGDDSLVISLAKRQLPLAPAFIVSRVGNPIQKIKHILPRSVYNSTAEVGDSYDSIQERYIDSLANIDNRIARWKRFMKNFNNSGIPLPYITRMPLIEYNDSLNIYTVRKHSPYSSEYIYPLFPKSILANVYAEFTKANESDDAFMTALRLCVESPSICNNLYRSARISDNDGYFPIRENADNYNSSQIFLGIRYLLGDVWLYTFIHNNLHFTLNVTINDTGEPIAGHLATQCDEIDDKFVQNLLKYMNYRGLTFKQTDKSSNVITVNYPGDLIFGMSEIIDPKLNGKERDRKIFNVMYRRFLDLHKELYDNYKLNQLEPFKKYNLLQ